MSLTKTCVNNCVIKIRSRIRPILYKSLSRVACDFILTSSCSGPKTFKIIHTHIYNYCKGGLPHRKGHFSLTDCVLDSKFLHSLSLI